MEKGEVRRIRLALGLTQAQLAEKIGVHAFTVSRWERGAVHVQEPTAQLLRLLAKQPKARK